MASDWVAALPQKTRAAATFGMTLSGDRFNYAGRPMELSGPADRLTYFFVDSRGDFRWFDRDTYDVWHREAGPDGAVRYACSYYRICKRKEICRATTDGAVSHNHGKAGVPLHFLRQIRVEFAVRNYYALSREIPNLEPFLMVYRFYHDRIHGSQVPCPAFELVPKWAVCCAKQGFPYMCESRRVGRGLSGIMEYPVRHILALLEVNAVFEEERYGLLDPYLKCALPMDYQGENLLDPVLPMRPYLRRWGIPGIFTRCSFPS